MWGNKVTDTQTSGADTPTPMATLVANFHSSKVIREEISNPANSHARDRPKAPRIPMSQMEQQLKVEPLPGYYMHWFKESNVERAKQAYFSFVYYDEVNVARTSLASDARESGNTDLGSCVSFIAATDSTGRPIRAYLMKLPLEYHLQDMKSQQRRNINVMGSIFGDEVHTGMGLGGLIHASTMVDTDGALRAADELTYHDRDRMSFTNNRDKVALFNRPIRKAKRLRPRILNR